jgi:hypothetical protein
MRKIFPLLAVLMLFAVRARAADLCTPFPNLNNYWCDTQGTVTTTPVTIQSTKGLQTARMYIKIQNNSDVNGSQAVCGVCFGATQRQQSCGTTALPGTLIRAGAVYYLSNSGTNGPVMLNSLMFNSDISIVAVGGGTCSFSVTIDG